MNKDGSSYTNKVLETSLLEDQLCSYVIIPDPEMDALSSIMFKLNSLDGLSASFFRGPSDDSTIISYDEDDSVYESLNQYVYTSWSYYSLKAEQGEAIYVLFEAASQTKGGSFSFEVSQTILSLDTP